MEIPKALRPWAWGSGKRFVAHIVITCVMINVLIVAAQWQVMSALLSEDSAWFAVSGFTLPVLTFSQLVFYGCLYHAASRYQAGSPTRQIRPRTLRLAVWCMEHVGVFAATCYGAICLLEAPIVAPILLRVAPWWYPLVLALPLGFAALGTVTIALSVSIYAVCGPFTAKPWSLTRAIESRDAIPAVIMSSLTIGLMLAMSGAYLGTKWALGAFMEPGRPLILSGMAAMLAQLGVHLALLNAYTELHGEYPPVAQAGWWGNPQFRRLVCALVVLEHYGAAVLGASILLWHVGFLPSTITATILIAAGYRGRYRLIEFSGSCIDYYVHKWHNRAAS